MSRFKDALSANPIVQIAMRSKGVMEGTTLVPDLFYLSAFTDFSEHSQLATICAVCSEVLNESESVCEEDDQFLRQIMPVIASMAREEGRIFTECFRAGMVEKAVKRTYYKIRTREFSESAVLKMLFSLGTHAALSLEDSRHARTLLKAVHEKIASILNNERPDPAEVMNFAGIYLED